MGKYDGFKSVEVSSPERSTFDLSHEKRVSSRMGRLTPIFISETMPNDTFNCSSEIMVKLAPLIAPIFHRLNLYVHFFFVPNRLLWKEWEPFITGGRIGEEATPPNNPTPPNTTFVDIGAMGEQAFNVGSLWDYLGGAPFSDATVAGWADRTVDLLPWAACYKCWYDYYRDRNYVQDNLHLPLTSGYNNDGALLTELISLRSRGWEHDYFTSSLPFTQRGAEVLMPLEGTGHVVRGLITGAPLASGALNITNPGSESQIEDSLGVLAEFVLDSSEVSINDFRRAMALQKWMERNALGGSRYPEVIYAHFRRKTSDGRLQRAEYLGGGKAVIQITEVMTTAFSEDAGAEVIPPGNPAGRGSSYSTSNRFSYNCEEHGFVIGFLSVMPSSGYMQGVPRMFLSRRTFLDYPWPTMAHLGEQEVYDYEIFGSTTSIPVASGVALDGYPVFGYQSRYSDWKFIHNSCHGDFRDTLDFWHLTRKFAAQPVLGDIFVRFEDGLQDRVFNVSTVDNLWMYIYNNVKVKRSLPYFGTPK